MIQALDQENLGAIWSTHKGLTVCNLVRLACGLNRLTLQRIDILVGLPLTDAEIAGKA